MARPGSDSIVAPKRLACPAQASSFLIRIGRWSRRRADRVRRFKRHLIECLRDLRKAKRPGRLIQTSGPAAASPMPQPVLRWRVVRHVAAIAASAGRSMRIWTSVAWRGCVGISLTRGETRSDSRLYGADRAAVVPELLPVPWRDRLHLAGRTCGRVCASTAFSAVR